MKYFRYYPWGIRLVLFLMMIVTMMGFISVMVMMLLPRLTGFTLVQIETLGVGSSASLVNAALSVQGIFSLFVFFVPGALFAYLTSPRPLSYLGLRKPGKNIQLLLVVCIMLGSIPLLQLVQAGVSLIDFGPKVKEAQAASDKMFEAFLSVKDFGGLLKILFVMAVIPAVGEELFFRGVMLRFAKQQSATMLLPILFTAAMFAWSHTNIYGIPSIFLAGILLAVIYQLTGSLWCSMLAHFVFNGAQVAISFFGESNTTIKRLGDDKSVPIYFVIAGAVVFCTSLFLLVKNKTPLSPDWTDDFTPDELTQEVY